MQLGAAQSLGFLGPELALAASMLVVWVLRRRGIDAGTVGVVGAALAAAAAAGLYGWGEVWLCQRLFVVDGLAVFAKLVIAVALVAAFWIERDSVEVLAMLLAALALDLVASAANSWAAVVALEVAYLATSRTTLTSAIATLATVASLAWLSGFAGSADFEWLRAGLSEVAPHHARGASLLAGAFLGATLARFVGTAFCCDTPALGLLVTVALPTGIVALLSRLFFGALSGPGEAGRWLAPPGFDWRPLLAFAAAATVASGCADLLRARSYPRLLRGSSVAGAGYALVGLSVSSIDGLRAGVFFTAVAALATIGAFFAASRVRGSLRHPAIAFFVLASAGAPLLTGFAAKPAILDTAPALAGLVVIAVAAQLVAGTRVIRGSEEVASNAPTAAIEDLCGLGVLVAATIAVYVRPEPLLRFAARSTHLLPF